MNTLAALVESGLGHSPFSGSLFVFINRRRETIKLLYYDKTVFAPWLKRLEKDVFRLLVWPQAEGAAAINSTHLDHLLFGSDVFKMAPH